MDLLAAGGTGAAAGAAEGDVSRRERREADEPSSTMATSEMRGAAREA